MAKLVPGRGWVTAAAIATGLVCASLYATGTSVASPPGGVAPGLAKAAARSAKSLDKSNLGKHPLTTGLARKGGSGPGSGETGEASGIPSSGNYAFLLELGTPGTMTAYGKVAPRGKAAASAAAKAQFQQVKAEQAPVVAALPSGTHVLYRLHSVMAGVGVYTDVRNLTALKSIAGVKAVYPIAPKSAANSYAVPLQGAPQVWTGRGDLGQNTKIAIIDTGIDYTHANFGGPGTTSAYQTALATDTQPADPDLFPSNKIVGGTDLVGDTYNADPTDPNFQPDPTPDANPLDCAGHGSHVAGTAAGLGENADGSTYSGAYNSSTTFGTMRIGPGMAPHADLLAYKVFGCAGSTDVIGQAIDMAADPNGDGDPADHATVINMSLGADFGSPQDGDSVASNVASSLGISVVVASGNAGDYYDAGGSPGDAVRTIAVANSVDAQDILDTLTVTAPVSVAGPYGAARSVAYDWTTGPDLSGSVVALSEATNKDGCDALDPSDATLVAGKIAFLEWTDDDTTRRCGSVVRATNIKDAGGAGFIFADDQETFAAGITGTADIPGVLVTKSAGDAIRAALGSGVTIGGTTAASTKQVIAGNNDKLNASSSRGVRGPGNVKPDVSAVGTGVFSTGMGTGNEGVSESGTSMATPMVAGLAALVRSAHPDWTPEEVKADIMNTAGQDLFTGDNHGGTKYAPNRVGAGRIQANAAVNNLVVAYVANDPGAVSASFGPVAVTAPTTLTKTVNVVNKGVNPATYTIAYQALSTVPGVSYTVSPSSVTVAGGTTKTVTVSLVIANPKLLTKTIDPTMSHTQATLPREFLADASGRVVLTPTDLARSPLRVPVYSAPRPASTMTQSSSLTLPAGSLQKANLGLSGTGVAQGSGSARIDSMTAGFELQATSGLAPVCGGSVTSGCVNVSGERSADLKYVGVTSDAPQVRSLGGDPSQNSLAYFAIATQGAWRTAASTQEFDIYIDSTGDNVPDAVLFNTRLNGQDVFVSELVDLITEDVLDIELIDDRFGNQDAALFDSDTMVMPVFLGALPNLASGGRIRYGIASFSNLSANPIDVIGLSDTGLQNPLTFNTFSPGVVVYGAYNANTSFIRYQDLPGTSLVMRRDTTTYYTDHALGALMLHFQNGVGSKAKVVALKSASSVSLKLSATTIRLGSTATATVAVANSGGKVATGKVNIRNVGGGVFTSGSLANGRVTLSVKPGSRGTFKVRAEYGGDAYYNPGNSVTLTLRVT